MKTAFLNIASSLTLAALTLVTSVAAHAAPVTYEWSTISKSDASQFGLRAGDKISGVLTYDVAGSSKTHGNAWGAVGSGYQYYDTPAVKTTLNMGTYQGTVDLYTMIVNDFDMWGGDEVFFRANNSLFSWFEIGFVDNSKTALGSLDLPQTIDLASYNRSYVSASNYWGGFNISSGSFNEFTPAAEAVADVPEPGSMALFGLALAGLAAASRRRVR